MSYIGAALNRVQIDCDLVIRSTNFGLFGLREHGNLYTILLAFHIFTVIERERARDIKSSTGVAWKSLVFNRTRMKGAAFCLISKCRCISRLWSPKHVYHQIGVYELRKREWFLFLCVRIYSFSSLEWLHLLLSHCSSTLDQQWNEY